MEMDLCSQLESMNLEKQWGKEKVSIVAYPIPHDFDVLLPIEQGKRNPRSAQYACDRRRSRSHNVRLRGFDLPCKQHAHLSNHQLSNHQLISDCIHIY